jgi:hypothetical protein
MKSAFATLAEPLDSTDGCECHDGRDVAQHVQRIGDALIREQIGITQTLLLLLQSERIAQYAVSRRRKRNDGRYR